MAALGRIGFDADGSAGNFRIDRAISAPVDFAALADLMLRALHDGYGAQRYQADIQRALCVGTSSGLRSGFVIAQLALTLIVLSNSAISWLSRRTRRSSV